MKAINITLIFDIYVIDISTFSWPNAGLIRPTPFAI